MRKGVFLLIKGVGYIWKPLIFMVSFLLAGGLASFWIALIVFFFFAAPFLGYFIFGSEPASVLLLANLFFIVGITLTMLVLSILRLVFRTRLSRPWRIGFWSFWLINLISFIALLSMLARGFNHRAEVSSAVGIFPERDTLNLKVVEDYTDEVLLDLDGLKLSEDHLYSPQVSMEIHKGDTRNFEIEVLKYARGATQTEAAERARNIVFKPQTKASDLQVPVGFIIEKNEKWRVQEIEVHLKVPVGKSVKISPEISDMLRYAEKGEDILIWQNPNRIWHMEEKGLVCSNCLR